MILYQKLLKFSIQQKNYLMLQIYQICNQYSAILSNFSTLLSQIFYYFISKIANNLIIFSKLYNLLNILLRSMQRGYIHIDNNYKYKEEDQLGGGNYAQVYKGQSVKYGTVAIKKFHGVICKKYYSDKQFQAIVKRQLVVNKLNHENIIKFYQFLEVNKQLYFIIQYCSGGTLQDYLKNNILEVNQIIDIFCQMVFAMAYINRQKILHRDLKPANILMSNKKIKIGDFGLCKVISNDIYHTPFQGTPFYMAPNIVKQCYDYTNKCDVWSFGLIIYELLTKKMLFQAKNVKQIIDKHDQLAKIPFKLLANFHPFFKILEKVIVYNQSQRLSFEQLEKYVLAYKQKQLVFEVRRATLYYIASEICFRHSIKLPKVTKLRIIFLTSSMQVLELEKAMNLIKSLKLNQQYSTNFNKIAQTINKQLVLAKTVKKKSSQQLIKQPYIQIIICPALYNEIKLSCEQSSESIWEFAFFQQQFKKLCKQIQKNNETDQLEGKLGQIVSLKNLKDIFKFSQVNKSIKVLTKAEKHFKDTYQSYFSK